MDRPNEVQIILTEHNIDHRKAAHLGCPPGIVLIEMLPEADRLGSLYLPDRLAANMRPDIGIVLSCGPDVTLFPGQMVAVDGYQGQWLAGFEVPGYSTDNQVRVLGKYVQHAHGETVKVPWDECVLALILPEEENMVAVKNNLIVRRDPLITHEGGIELPSYSQYHTGFGAVESIGPQCDLATSVGDVQVGSRIHFDNRSVREFVFNDDADLIIIPDLAVNFVIAAEAVAA